MVCEVEVGAQVPRRGNGFSRWLGRSVLRLMGWRITGEMPNLPKVVVIGAPHTSNRDGLIGMATVLALGLRISLMAKHTLFRWPLGGFLRWLGVIPIDRDQAGGVVALSLEKFREKEKLFLGIAPEGTRHAAAEWKTGFYRIAREAGVPILAAVFDYGKKELRLALTLMPGEDRETDLERILSCYRGITPARPDRLSAPLRRP